jgi:hypothetical protein
MRVNTAARAQDSLGVVDASIDTVVEGIAQIDAFLDNYYYPFGEALVEGIAFNEFIVDASNLRILEAGDLIGPNSEFGDGSFAVDSLRFNDKTSGFFGLRFLIDDQFHYGWISVGLGNDESLVIRDFAFESNSDHSIRAGFVPEPSNKLTLVIAILIVIARIRCDQPND